MALSTYLTNLLKTSFKPITTPNQSVATPTVPKTTPTYSLSPTSSMNISGTANSTPAVMPMAQKTTPAPATYKPTVPNLTGTQTSTPYMTSPPIQAPTYSMGVPTVPTPAPTPAPAPVIPKTSSGQTINPATGGVSNSSYTPPQAPATNTPPATGTTPPSSQTPAVPTVTEYDKAMEELSKNTQMTEEEVNAQKELDAISESLRQGYLGEGDRAIPLAFITGRQKSLETRAATLSEPIKARAALAQAKRTAALEASKFKVEQEAAKADAKANAEKPITVGAGSSIYDPTTGKSVFTAPSSASSDSAGAFTIGNTRYDAQGNVIIKADDASQATPEESAKKIQQFDYLSTVANDALKYADSSGQSGIRQAAGKYLWGATDYTNLVSQTNTLRTNLLTLMADPDVKKFFGPQMSNADVQFMLSGGTTLNPELQDPTTLKAEIVRVQDTIRKAKEAVQQGQTTTGGNEWTW